MAGRWSPTKLKRESPSTIAPKPVFTSLPPGLPHTHTHTTDRKPLPGWIELVGSSHQDLVLVPAASCITASRFLMTLPASSVHIVVPMTHTQNQVHVECYSKYRGSCTLFVFRHEWNGRRHGTWDIGEMDMMFFFFFLPTGVVGFIFFIFCFFGGYHTKRLAIQTLEDGLCYNRWGGGGQQKEFVKYSKGDGGGSEQRSFGGRGGRKMHFLQSQH